MTSRLKLFLTLLALVAAQATGLPFSVQDELDWADRYWDKEKEFPDPLSPGGVYRRDSKYECGHFSLRGKGAGCQGLYEILRGIGKAPGPCVNRYRRYDDGMPELSQVLPYLEELGFTVERRTWYLPWTPDYAHVKSTFTSIGAGDEFLIWTKYKPKKAHAGIIYDDDEQNERIPVREHSNYLPRRVRDFVDIVTDYWYDINRNQNPNDKLNIWIIHPPADGLVANCDDQLYRFSFDSTFRRDFGCAPGSDGGYIRHAWRCCWHENLACTWPWFADSTAYACLSWQESTGTTWDTLVTPRMTFVGCSAVVFRQNRYSWGNLGTLPVLSRRQLSLCAGCPGQEARADSRKALSFGNGHPLARLAQSVRRWWFISNCNMLIYSRL